MTAYDPPAAQAWTAPPPRSRPAPHPQIPGSQPLGNADGDRPEHEVHSLRALFRERRLSIRTMERPLRLATGAAAASLLGTVLLIALRDIAPADVALGRTNGIVTAVSQPVFVATLVLISVGFAYVLTGAVLASPPVAVLVLIVITAEIGVYTGAFGSLFGFDGLYTLLPHWARWTSRGLIVLIWLVAIAVIVIDRRRGRLPTRKTRLSVLALYAVLFGGYFTVLKVASPTVGHLDLFPEAISLLMINLVDLVTPILFIAAVDFGEWGGLLGERVAAAIKTRRAWLLTPVAALLAASLMVWGYAHATSGTWFDGNRYWVVVRSTLIVAGALVVMIVVGRAMRLHHLRWPATLNFAGIFAAVAISLYVIAPLAGVIAGKFHGVATPVEQVTPEGRYTAAADVTLERGGKGTSAYSVLIPRGWLRQNLNGATGWLNAALPGKKPGELVKGLERAYVFTISSRPTPEQLAAGLHLEIDGSVESEGEWRVARTTVSQQAAQLWVRENPKGGAYVLEFLVSGVPEHRVEPQWKAIAETFRTAGQPPATLESEPEPPESEAQKANDRLQAAVFELTVPLALALLVLVAIFGRRWSRRLVGAMLLFAVMTVATVLYFADEFGRGLFGSGTHLPYLGSAGLLAAVGLLSLLALAIPFREPGRRRTLVVGLIALQATVWTLVGMSVLYDHALAASRIAVWAAIIVLVAIAWDVVMSGESMTNEGSKRLPRASRVLAFLGYVIIVSATVLFYSGQRTTGTGQAAESLIEPEAITRNGLFRVAFPLAVLMFLLRFGRERRRRQDAPGPEAVRGWASSHSDSEV